ncbi:MAG TPA: hypothetical protein VIJ33_06625 [Solirubrobacteraceae bacterium]
MSEPTVPGEPGAAVTEPQPALSAPVVPEPATAITQPIPVVTSERCAQCAAALAHDQRYCLQCGEPRPHLARSPQLGGPPSAAESAAQKSPQAPPVPPGYGPASPAASATRNNSLTLIAGVGVLLLAMGVGVLIGRAGVGTTKTPPAQVIAVGGSTGAPTTPTTTTPTTSTPATETPDASAKKKTEAKPKERAGAGSSITKPASSSVLKSLDKGKESAQSYEEKSKSLPNVVLTK